MRISEHVNQIAVSKLFVLFFAEKNLVRCVVLSFGFALQFCACVSYFWRKKIVTKIVWAQPPLQSAHPCIDIPSDG